MAKLIIMQGLPGSGKSTQAEALFVGGKNVRLNRDLLREMLHFGKWTSDLEKQTVRSEKTLATMFLGLGLDVVIDDTNLSKRAVKMWENLAIENKVLFCVAKMDTPIEECIVRDRKRGEMGGRCVGEEVIRRMGDGRY